MVTSALCIRGPGELCDPLLPNVFNTLAMYSILLCIFYLTIFVTDFISLVHTQKLYSHHWLQYEVWCVLG